MAWTDGIVLKIINVIVFATTLGSSSYSFTVTAKETYISPAPFAFYIWSLIHLLLLGFIVYQFTERGKELIVDRIQWRFALVGILSTVYTWLGIRGWFISAFILSLLVAASVSTVYYIVRTSHAGGNLWSELFVHAPFSLFHAWALCLVVISGFEAFGREIHHHAGIWTKVFVFLGLLFLETSAVGYAFASSEGDIGGAAVITWTLWAIFVEQSRHSSAFIKWSALAFAILSTFNVIKSLIFTWRSGGALAILHDEERQPLTQG